MTKARPKADRLTAHERQFVAHYLVHENATQAALDVRPHLTYDAAKGQGWRWMQKPSVLAEIDRRLRPVLARSVATREQVLREMSRIATCDPADLLNHEGKLLKLNQMPPQVRACIRSIKKRRGEVEITFWDKDHELTNLGKFHKILTEHLEITHSFADRLAKARERRLKAQDNTQKKT